MFHSQGDEGEWLRRGGLKSTAKFKGNALRVVLLIENFVVVLVSESMRKEIVFFPD